MKGGDPFARLEGARGLKTPTLSSLLNHCDMINHSAKVTNVNDREKFPSKSLKRKHIFSYMTKKLLS